MHSTSVTAEAASRQVATNLESVPWQMFNHAMKQLPMSVVDHKEFGNETNRRINVRAQFKIAPHDSKPEASKMLNSDAINSQTNSSAHLYKRH